MILISCMKLAFIALFASGFVIILASGADREIVMNYDAMLARWMVHSNETGTLYVDSNKRDPGKSL